MPKAIYAVICDDVREEKSGKVSVMGIFDRFLIANFSQPMSGFHIFAKVGFENEGDHNFTICLRSIEGEKIFEATATTHARDKDEVTDLYLTNVNLGLNNLLLPRPGNYEVAFLHNGLAFHIIKFAAIVKSPPLVQ